MEKIEKLVEEIEKLTVIELADLVKAIEEKFGVTAAAPVAVAAAAEEAAPQGPTSFTVVLTAPGDSKVGVIKLVREITGLGLVDAKKLVDGAPATIKENVPAEEAEALKKKLMDAGASVELK